MGFDCRVYGLALESAFELPGLPPAAAGPAERMLELALEAPNRLEARWSGPVGPGAWRGWLREGAELSIRWGKDGDLLFAYDGDRATFLLDPEARRLGCAPADPEALDWRRVLLSRVLPLVAIARGAEALHAGAVAIGRGAVAVLAPSGGGKSTLIAELAGRGRALIGDDVLVLTREATGVRAQPASPHLSLDDGARAAARSLGVLGGKHWLGVEGAVVDERPVAALVLLERRHGAGPRVEAMPASPLALAPFMIGLPDHEDRDAGRFALYSDLVAEAPLLSLRAAPEDSPGALADELERALAERTPTFPAVGL